MRFFGIIIIFTYSLSIHGQLIVDESYKDVDFWIFKQHLEKAVMQQDTTLLKSLLADRVFESTDSESCTKTQLIKYCFTGFRKGQEHFVWDELELIIRFGFYQKKDVFPTHPILHDELVYIAPSYLKTVDTANALIVLSTDVNIRRQPGLSAKIIRTASFEKFRCNCNVISMTDTTFQTVDGIDWIEIVMNENTVGYIAAKYTSYVVEKKLHIGKVNGAWKIIRYYSPPGC